MRALQSLKSLPNRVVSNIAGDFYSKNNLHEKRRAQMEEKEDREDRLSGIKERQRKERFKCVTCGSPSNPQLICHDCESPELWEK